jgi:hypothetical protein
MLQSQEIAAGVLSSTSGTAVSFHGSQFQAMMNFTGGQNQAQSFAGGGVSITQTQSQWGSGSCNPCRMDYPTSYVD